METQKNVQHHLADMVKLEARLYRETDPETGEFAGQMNITDALNNIQSIAREHRTVLENRLEQLRDISDLYNPGETDEKIPGLIHIYGLICEVALGYSLLYSLAHRSYDREEEGNTRDTAKNNLYDYADAVTDLLNLITDLITDELDENGDECRCHCNTCELGICTCSPMGIGRVHREWLDTVSSVPLGRILVTNPRKGSAAIDAGLSSGDTILAADGRDIHSNAELHEAIKKHAQGEAVILKVKSRSGETREITLESRE